MDAIDFRPSAKTRWPPSNFSNICYRYPYLKSFL